MMGAEQRIAEANEFFAPSSLDTIDSLVAQYQAERASVEQLASLIADPDMQNAVGYFLNGNRDRFNRYTPDPHKLFALETALPALDARYWQRALDLTDVLDYMPDAKRQEWHNQIHEMKTPEFSEGSVRATLETLLSQRMDFLAEMVDGLFRGLSGEHVTNRPEGFSRRMIVDYVYGAFGLTDRKAGLLHDLRSIIAKFMGRDNPPWIATMRLLDHMRKTTGVWHTVDGGALRIRVYKKGTAHIEVHPDLAWRLNQVLAHLHPAAIPGEHRTKPKTRPKAHTLIDRPLPFAVLEELRVGRWAFTEGCHVFQFSYAAEPDKRAKKEALSVLQALGGAPSDEGTYFDYDAKEVIGEILAFGVIPDQKAYQFYPTPPELVDQVIDLADIGSDDNCLEPSAGTGAIADHIPSRLITCVEASPLHCKVLESKGYVFECVDFLEWKHPATFDRIVMNPPFDRRRAQAHLEHAAEMLTPGGRLVSILPAGLRGKDVLPGYSVTWHGEHAFPGTSINVTILAAERTST